MTNDPALRNTTQELLLNPEQTDISPSVDSETFVLPPDLLSDSLLLSEMESSDSLKSDLIDAKEIQPIEKSHQTLTVDPVISDQSDNVLPIDLVHEKTYHQRVKDEIAAYLKSREKKKCRNKSGKPSFSIPTAKKQAEKPASIIKRKKILQTKDSVSGITGTCFSIKRVKDKKPKSSSPLENRRSKKANIDTNRPVINSRKTIQKNSLIFEESSKKRPLPAKKTPAFDRFPIERHKNIIEEKDSIPFLYKPKPDKPVFSNKTILKLKDNNKPDNFKPTNSQIKSHSVVKSNLPDIKKSSKKNNIFEKKRIISNSMGTIGKTESVMQMDIIEKRSSTTNRNFSLCQKILPLQLI